MYHPGRRNRHLFNCLRDIFNQSDWRGKRLVKLVEIMRDDATVREEVAAAQKDFQRQNVRKARKGTPPIPESEASALSGVLSIAPLYVGVIDACDNWVVEVHKDFARMPNDNEWQRLVNGPLDGAIGMSFALQWRYNFGRLFGMDLPQSDD